MQNSFHLRNLSRVRIFIDETTCHHAICALVTLSLYKHIVFKMLTIIFKCYSDCAPSYVKELITPYQPNYSGLWSSSDSRMLTKPKTNLKSSTLAKVSILQHPIFGMVYHMSFAVLYRLNNSSHCLKPTYFNHHTCALFCFVVF